MSWIHIQAASKEAVSECKKHLVSVLLEDKGAWGQETAEEENSKWKMNEFHK